MGEPAMAPISGRNPEIKATTDSASEPAIPPNPLASDFPYPARISAKDEYMRVEAIAEPSLTPP